MNSDWRDGFLFVGNHLALDFLNTCPVMDGEPIEMLTDGAALARWLAAAGLTTERESVRLGRRWAAADSSEAIAKVLKLRERLRHVVFQIEGGNMDFPAFIKNINQLLIEHPYLDQVVTAVSGSDFERSKRFEPELPEDAFAPLADAIADLVTKTDCLRIRKCKSCVVHFYDTSKKGTRLWCSMNICGNRSKVAAFADRKRVAEMSS